NFSRITRHITLDATPIVAANVERDSASETRIATLIEATLRREVRVHPVSGEEARAIGEQIPPRQDPLTGVVGPVNMIISVNAGEAGWINVRYRPPEPRARYGPALISGLIAVGVALLATLWTQARFAAPLQALTRA